MLLSVHVVSEANVNDDDGEATERETSLPTQLGELCLGESCCLVDKLTPELVVLLVAAIYHIVVGYVFASHNQAHFTVWFLWSL